MIKLTVTEKITRTTTLSNENEKILLDYIKNHKMEFINSSSCKHKLLKAAWILKDKYGVDFLTNSTIDKDLIEGISWSEKETRSADEILSSVCPPKESITASIYSGYFR